jgi:hypothetical protein
MEQIFDLLKQLLKTVEKDGSKSSDSEVQVIRNLFGIVTHLKPFVKGSIAWQLINYKDCQDLLVLGLIMMQQLQFRETFYEQLKDLLEVEESVAQEYLELLLLRVLELAVEMPNNCRLKEFFMLASHFLSLLTPQEIKLFR